METKGITLMQHKRLPLKALMIAVLLALLAPPAHAWNAQGHQIIALVAYDQLRPETRTKVLDLLHKHPRFEQHFTNDMPDEVWKGSDAEKDGWLFGQAAIWPDLVKRKSDIVTDDDVTRFNRPVWHYIDFPIYLDDTERTLLEKSIRENLDTVPPKDEFDDRSMNVIQAIRNSGRVVKSSKNDSERAIHLCWLFHLVGDSHQPLHSSALFTSARFPKGDEGGNGIMVRGKLKLHAYWDGAISRDRKYNGVRRKAFDLLNNRGLDVAGEEAIKSLQPEDWIQEGHEIAKNDVYTEHIRKLVADAEGRENLGDMNPPRGYDRSSAQISEKRAVEAGYRLAALLERLFPQ